MLPTHTIESHSNDISRYVLTWDDLKLLLCGIEGVYLSTFCAGKHVALTYPDTTIITSLDSKKDFIKLHLSL